MKKQILSILLCLSMAMALLPAVAFATDESAIQLGADGISDDDYVYYGMDGTTPIKWRVLDANANNNGISGGMFLLSEYLLDNGTVTFDNSGTNTWQNSDAQAWCTAFADTSNGYLTPQELAAIQATTKTDGSGYYYFADWSTSSLSSEQVFFLSAEEAAGYIGSNVGDGDTGLAAVTAGGSHGWWWLRSPHDDYTHDVGVVANNGIVDLLATTYDWAARPAFNLNLSSVLFASAAAGGKSSGAVGAGALNANLTPTSTTEWKLTLEDTNRDFAISNIINTENTVYFDYSGATPYNSTTAPDEYISAIITDSSGNITYYGRIAQPSAATGTASIDLSNVTMNTTDTLYVFSEQANGDHETDYASALQTVSTTVNAYSITNSLTNLTTSGLDYVANDNTTDYTATLSAGTGYLRPSNITSVTVGGTPATLASSADDADTAGEYYYDASTGAVKVAAVSGAVVITAAGVAKTYTISASPSSIDFSSLTEGYTAAPAAQTVTITNNGNSDVTGYTVTGGGTDFDVTYTSAAILAGGTSAFSVQPITGLSAGTHTATLTVTTSEDTTGTVDVTFYVNAYTISASPSSIDFGSLTVGYTAAPAAQTVTITNNGNSDVTGYTVTGGGTDFDVTYTSAAILAGSTSTFSVQPITGLSAGTHTATLTVTTSKDTTATVDVTFYVKTYTISALPESIDFSSLTEGYTAAPAAQKVTITNNGNSDVAGYTVTGGGTDFNVTYTSSAIASGGTSTFSVQPITGLAAGEHTATLTVTTSEDTTATLSLSFTVTEASSSGGGSSVTRYTITATTSTGGSISPSGSTSVVYGNDKTYTITADNGYEIKDVLVDGESVGVVTSYTFENVKKVHTIAASFAETEEEIVNPFADVNTNDWFYENVMFVYENGLMNGTGGDTFAASNTLTRGMFVAILYRMSGDGGTYTNPFGDVPSGKYYENSAAWAYENGITRGIGNNCFRPGLSITREQIAVMLYHYAEHMGYDVSVGEDINILSYNDALNISDYAYSALQWACGAGVMNGDDLGNLNPQSTATRAEVAAILERFCENVTA